MPKNKDVVKIQISFKRNKNSEEALIFIFKNIYFSIFYSVKIIYSVKKFCILQRHIEYKQAMPPPPTFALKL